jgi:hypothetical protein
MAAMGRRGPAPFPPKLARARGDYRPCRHASRQDPAATGPLGPPPPHLTEEVVNAWLEIEGGAPDGHLTSADRSAVEALAVAVVAHRRAALAYLAAEAPSERVENAVSRHASTIARLVKVLALGPLDRLRMAAEGPSKSEEQPESEAWQRLKRFSIVRGGNGPA